MTKFSKDSTRNPVKPRFKARLQIVIFGTDTLLGRWFDILLIIAILLSTVSVLMSSLIPTSDSEWNHILFNIEWGFTILFTTEYLLRIYTSHQPKKYIFSFFGIIDLISIIPAYLSLFLVGTHYLLVIRVLRVFRIFRIFKLVKYLKEVHFLLTALSRSFRKITVFLLFVFILTVIFGSIMYVVEGSENGFTSIPKSIYWAIVTLTTVGYGDISPQTPLGQTIAALVMVLGYSIVVVPTGIVSADLSQNLTQHRKQSLDQPSDKAKYCKHCGKPFDA